MGQCAQLMDHKGKVRPGPDDTAPTIPNTEEAEILTKKADNRRSSSVWAYPPVWKQTHEKWVNPEENDTAWPEGDSLMEALRLCKPQSIH